MFAGGRPLIELRQRILGLRDYQRGWLLTAILLGIREETLEMWQLLGAETARFFERGKDAVLAVLQDLPPDCSKVFPTGSTGKSTKRRTKRAREREVSFSLITPEKLNQIFEEAYEKYPRHLGKRAAEKAFERAVGRHWDSHSNIAQFIARRAAEFACSDAGKKGKYTPHMATWLNQDRFLDDPADWAENARIEYCTDSEHQGRDTRGRCWECGKVKP